MYLAIALVVLVVLLLIYWIGVKDYSLIADVSVNGPKPWPYVGNLPDILKYGGMHKMLWEYFRRFGRVHKLYLGRRPGFAITDPEMVKQITVKEFHKFRNRPEFIKINPPLSYAVGFARDDTWKRIRTILTPTFSTAKLKQLVPLIEDSCAEMEKKMSEFSETGKLF